MVQNWENFMMPDGGTGMSRNALMDGGMGLFFAFGVDAFGSPILNRLQQGELKFAGRIQSKFGPSDIESIANNPSYGPGKKIAERIQQQHYARRNAIRSSRQLRSNIRSNYGTLKSLSKGLGWGLLAMSAASIVEDIVSPGITREAMNIDQGITGPTYLDTPQAYTQRQRALMAIHESQLGIKGIIGQEASGFHK